MYFESREIPSYAVPVNENDLVEGHSYFILTFIDEDLSIPILRTIIYLGKDLNVGDIETRHDVEYFYFQDVVSYYQEKKRTSKKGVQKGEYHRYIKGQMKSVFTFEHALEGLMKCSLNRKSKV